MSAAALPLDHTFLSSLESSMEPDMTTAQPSPVSGTAPRSASRTSRPSSRSSARGGQTFLRAVRAEWVKLRTLRSTWITSALTLLLTTGTGAAITVAVAGIEGGAPDAWTTLPAGTTFGQIVVAVLGSLIITGEYSSGQVRSTLAATPRRTRVLAAKALVIAAWSFLLGVASIVLAWAVATPLMESGTISLADERMLGYVWGTGLAYAGLALMSLGLGFLLRSTAGAITAAVVLLFVAQIPLSLAAMRFEWAAKAGELLPSTVINAVIDPFSSQFTWAEAAGSTMWLTHTQAVLVFTAWALVPIVAGWVAFTRRDA